MGKIKKGISAYADRMDSQIKKLSSTQVGKNIVEILGMPKAVDLLKSISKEKKAKGGMMRKGRGGSVKKKTTKRK